MRMLVSNAFSRKRQVMHAIPAKTSYLRGRRAYSVVSIHAERAKSSLWPHVP